MINMLGTRKSGENKYTLTNLAASAKINLNEMKRGQTMLREKFVTSFYIYIHHNWRLKISVCIGSKNPHPFCFVFHWTKFTKEKKKTRLICWAGANHYALRVRYVAERPTSFRVPQHREIQSCTHQVQVSILTCALE